MMETETDASKTQLSAPVAPRTVWGMNALQLHDQYWAAQGVLVVRLGENTPLPAGARRFLLLPPNCMAVLSLAELDRQVLRRDVVHLRLRENSDIGERVVTDDLRRFVRFERTYRGGNANGQHTVLMCNDLRIAALWQMSADARSMTRKLKQVLPRHQRLARSLTGRIFDFADPATHVPVLHEIMRVWRDPQSVILRAKSPTEGARIDSTAAVPDDVRFVGDVWVGAGRQIDAGSVVIGPAVLWDEPDSQPKAQEIVLDPVGTMAVIAVARTSKPPKFRWAYRVVKRLLDIVGALIALALTLPLYPAIMAAIWLESGFPIFFSHRRETLHGRQFGCIKFRSMRRDAEKIKLTLAQRNQADGPQFFMEDDPRLTRVGRFLRELHLDELPQFINVLLGDMSFVGPRPSPYRENQFCPPWREARLSVPPGITGLWQVKRTREKDKDFQEWIQFDIEYVERASLLLDAWIIVQTILQIARRAVPRFNKRTNDTPEEPTSVPETSYSTR